MASSASITTSNAMNKADCPFSVEVEVSSPNRLRLSQKGWSVAIRRRSSLTAVTTDDSSSSWDDQYATPVTLVPVGSASESDDSDSVPRDEAEEEEEEEEEDELLATRSSQPPPPPPSDAGDRISPALMEEADCCTELESNNTLELIKNADKRCGLCQGSEPDAMGVYDCLADQITNLFCPVDHHKGVSGGGGPETNSVSASSLSTATSQMIGINPCGPDLDQLFTSQRGGANLFTSAFNFWLTPSQEEQLRKPPQPRNRSSASNRRRARHVQRLFDTWYPPTDQGTPYLVLQRSKSCNAITSKTIHSDEQQRQGGSCKSNNNKSSSDDFYDSDPEQEYQHRQQRKVDLMTPKPPATTSRRRSGCSTSSQPSGKSHYRQFRPVSIDCTYNSDSYGGRYDVMADSSVSTRTHTSIGQHIHHHQNGTTDQPTFTTNHVSDDGSTSYETAKTNLCPHPTIPVTMEGGLEQGHHNQALTSNTPKPPLAPRNSDRYSFDYEHTQMAGEVSSEQQRDGPSSSVVSHPDEPSYHPAMMTIIQSNHRHRDSYGSELSSLDWTHHPTSATNAVSATGGAESSSYTSAKHQPEQQHQQHPGVETSASASSYTSSTSASTTSSATTATTTTTVLGGVGATTAAAAGGGGTIISHTARNYPAYFQSPTHWTEFRLLYSNVDQLTKAYVQELSNVRFPLIWHPRGNVTSGRGGAPQKSCRSLSTTTDPSSSSSSSATALPHTHPCSTVSPAPMAVHGVFEVGAHLEHMVVQPKFTWSPIVQPDLQDNRRIVLNGSQPNSVELLSIIRVNKPTGATTSKTGRGVDGNSCTIDRRLYPFARLDRTVCITTNDVHHPHLVLEAPSRAERDWLVVALKLIVARLASIIIVRDEEMLLEFFSPYSALMQLDADEDLPGAITTTSSTGGIGSDLQHLPPGTPAAAACIPGMPPRLGQGARRRRYRRRRRRHRHPQLRQRRHQPNHHEQQQEQQQQELNLQHDDGLLDDDGLLMKTTVATMTTSAAATTIVVHKDDDDDLVVMTRDDVVEHGQHNDYYVMTEKVVVEDLSEEGVNDDGDDAMDVTDDDDDDDEDKMEVKDDVMSQVEDKYGCHHDHGQDPVVDDNDDDYDDDGDDEIETDHEDTETRQGPSSPSGVGIVQYPAGTTLDPAM